jgi:hypothetical protein
LRRLSSQKAADGAGPAMLQTRKQRVNARRKCSKRFSWNML